MGGKIVIGFFASLKYWAGGFEIKKKPQFSGIGNQENKNWTVGKTSQRTEKGGGEKGSFSAPIYSRCNMGSLFCVVPNLELEKKGGGKGEKETEAQFPSLEEDRAESLLTISRAEKERGSIRKFK